MLVNIQLRDKVHVPYFYRGDEPDYGVHQSGSTTSTDAVPFRPIPKEKDPSW